MNSSTPLRFTIDPMMDAHAVMLHGDRHPTIPSLRYINLECAGHGSLHGFVSEEMFAQLMRTLVTGDSLVPITCEVES